MADIKRLVRDPRFQSLSFEERRELLSRAAPDSFGSAPEQDQVQILNDMKKQDWWQPSSTALPRKTFPISTVDAAGGVIEGDLDVEEVKRAIRPVPAQAAVNVVRGAGGKVKQFGEDPLGFVGNMTPMGRAALTAIDKLGYETVKPKRDNAVSRAGQSMIESADAAERGIEEAEPLDPKSGWRSVRSGLASTYQQLPFLALGGLASAGAKALGMSEGLAQGVGMGASLLPMGNITEGDTYARLREKGFSPDDAGASAYWDKVFEIGTELIPTGRYIKVLSDRGKYGLKQVAATLMRAGAEEYVGESIATITQKINELYMGIPDMTPEQKMATVEKYLTGPGVWEDLADTFKTTTVQNVAMAVLGLPFGAGKGSKGPVTGVAPPPPPIKDTDLLSPAETPQTALQPKKKGRKPKAPAVPVAPVAEPQSPAPETESILDAVVNPEAGTVEPVVQPPPAAAPEEVAAPEPTPIPEEPTAAPPALTFDEYLKTPEGINEFIRRTKNTKARSKARKSAVEQFQAEYEAAQQQGVTPAPAITEPEGSLDAQAEPTETGQGGGLVGETVAETVPPVQELDGSPGTGVPLVQPPNVEDPNYVKAVQLAKKDGDINIPRIQAKLGVGYIDASRIMEQLEEDGIVDEQGAYQEQAVNAGIPGTDTSKTGAGEVQGGETNAVIEPVVAAPAKPAAKPKKTKKSKDFSFNGRHYVTLDDGTTYGIYHDRNSGMWHYESSPDDLHNALPSADKAGAIEELQRKHNEGKTGKALVFDPKTEKEKGSIDKVKKQAENVAALKGKVATTKDGEKVIVRKKGEKPAEVVPAPVAKEEAPQGKAKPAKKTEEKAPTEPAKASEKPKATPQPPAETKAPKEAKNKKAEQAEEVEKLKEKAKKPKELKTEPAPQKEEKPAATKSSDPVVKELEKKGIKHDVNDKGDIIVMRSKNLSARLDTISGEWQIYDGQKMTKENLSLDGLTFEEAVEEMDFSSAAFKVEEGKSAGATKAVVDKLLEPILKKWGNAPDVVVVQTDSELPPDIYDEIMDRNKEGKVGGVFIKDHKTGKAQVFIVAGNLPEGAKQAPSVVLHEVVGHYGIRGLLGDRFNKVLKDVYAVLERNEAFHNLAKVYKLDLSKERDRLIMADEALAKMAETNEHPHLVNRAIAAVREFLRKLGVNLQWTDNDIRSLIARAEGWVERGKGSSYFDGKRFIIADETRYQIKSTEDRERDARSFENPSKPTGRGKLMETLGLEVYHGNIVGAPKGVSDEKSLQKMIDKLVDYADKHPMSKHDAMWYAEVGRMIREVSHGDERLMEQMSRVLAYISIEQSVQMNAVDAIKSAYLIANGDRLEIGRYPNVAAEKLPVILAAPRDQVNGDLPGIGPKVEAFYRNIRDNAFQVNEFPGASTIDRHMARLMYETKDKDPRLTHTQNGFCQAVMKEVTRRYNHDKGTNLLPHQLQAVLWGAQLNMGKAKEDATKAWNYPEFIKQATFHVTLETRPSESVPGGQEIAKLSFDDMLQFHKEAMSIFMNGRTNELLEALGGILYHDKQGSGLFEGTIAPNETTGIVVQRTKAISKDKYESYDMTLARMYGRAVQYIFKQDGVPIVRPDYITPENLKKPEVQDRLRGALINFEAPLSWEQEKEFKDNLIAAFGPGAGYTKIAPDQIILLNFGGQTNEEFYDIVEDKLRGADDNGILTSDRFTAEGDYLEHDWKKDPAGKGLNDDGGWAGSPDLQERIDNWRSEYESLVEKWVGRAEDTTLRLSITSEGQQGRSGEPAGIPEGDRGVGAAPVEGLPVRDDGRVELTHWSKKEGLTELDPTYYGTAYAGAELRRKKNNPRNWVDRTYYAVNGAKNQYKKESGLGPHRYTASIDPSELYDHKKDPLGLKQKAVDFGTFDHTLYEKLIRDAGYNGFWVDHHQLGTVAAVFSKVSTESYVNEATPPGTTLDFMGLQTAYKMLSKMAKATPAAMKHLVAIGRFVLSEGKRSLSAFTSGMRSILGKLYPRFRSMVIGAYSEAKRLGAIALSTPSQLPAELKARHQAARQWVSDNYVANVTKLLSAYGLMPGRSDYLSSRYRLLGILDGINETVETVFKTLSKAWGTPDEQALYTYFTTKGARATIIQNQEVRDMAVRVKQQIVRIGDALVARGWLKLETHDQTKGSYLPRVYLKHLLGPKMFAEWTGGKKLDKRYLKKRKDIPPEFRRIILGEITDAPYLASRALSLPLRDLAISEWLEGIASNPAHDWALPKQFVKWRMPGFNKDIRVTPFWLKSEAERLREQADSMPAADAAQARAIADQMETAANQALTAAGFRSEQDVPKGYRMLPNTARYGALRGMVVKKEIYRDIVGTGELGMGENAVLQTIFGLGYKHTNFWKWSKAVGNLPGQVRNFITNMVLVHMSGVPLYLVPRRIVQAIHEVSTNGRHWQVAKKGGVRGATFANTELGISEESLKSYLSAKPQNLSWMSILHLLTRPFHAFHHATGKFYQFMEAVGKTAVIIDKMERGATEDDAIMAAHDALIDYSLVPGWMRFARMSPVGAPFITFLYAASRRVVLTALTAPWRFLPYIILNKVLPVLMLAMFGDDDDRDLEEMRKALPEWLKKKGSSVVPWPWKDKYGRWQFIDLSYFYPWQPVQELASMLASGDIGGTIKKTTFFGGPLVSLVNAMFTGKDPFNDKKIVPEPEPSMWEQTLGWMTYLYRLHMPTFVTDTGTAGKLHSALTEKPNKWDDPKTTVPQALMSLVGVNVYPLDYEQGVESNIKSYNYRIAEVKKARKKELDELSLKATKADVEEIYQKYDRKLQKIEKERGEYIGSLEEK